MIWLLTTTYFFIWSLVLVLGFVIYGKSLLIISAWKKSIKQKIGILMIYLIFACFMLTPLFSIKLISDWHELIIQNTLYSVFVLILYISCMIPGFKYFNNKYLSTLKYRGLFTK